MVRDRYFGVSTPEAKLNSARKLLKTTGLDDVADVLSQASAIGVKVERIPGSFGNGYYINPCLRLVGEWFPNGIAPMQTDSGLFEGTKNQRGMVSLQVPVQQLDSMGGGIIIIGGFVETNMDCVAGDEIVETQPVKASHSPIQLQVPGSQVWTGEIAPSIVETFVDFVLESGLIPEEQIVNVSEALAQKGYCV